MIKFDCILLAGGISNRFKENKLLIDICNKPLYMYSLEEILKVKSLNKLYLVINKLDFDYFNNISFNDKVEIVIGGNERFESVKNGLKNVTEEYCLIHDAARPLVLKDDIERIIEESIGFECASYYSKTVNTLREFGTTLNRDNILQIETPQVINKNSYNLILNNTELITDEIGLLENNKLNVKYLEMDHSNIKVTYPSDLDYVYYFLSKENNYRIGHSFDIHKYTDGTYITLGGIKIPYDKKVIAHSDGDVLSHALTEAIFGALSNKDLGDNYPDDDPRFKDYDSTLFLKDAKELLLEKQYEIENIDCLIYLEEPKLKQYKIDIINNISSIFNIEPHKVSIKATTVEKIGSIGNKEGLAVECLVLIRKIK